MVFTQIFRGLIIGLVVAAFTSCTSYRLMEVEVLQPSQLQIEKGKKIALLDRNVRRKVSPVVFTDGVTEVSLIRDFANGLNYVMTDIGYDTVVCLTEQTRTEVDSRTVPPALPKDSVESWCKKFHVDYIISLEMIQYDIWAGDINCKWTVRMYQCGIEKPIDGFILQNRLPGIVYSDWEKNLLPEMRAAFWDEGSAYAHRIIPSWVPTERRLYNLGKVLRMGDVLWQSGKQDEAIKIWKVLLKQSNKRGLKAGINLAWAYESNGDFDRALECLNRSEAIAKEKKITNLSSHYLKWYLQVIKERIKQRDILNQMMNLEEE